MENKEEAPLQIKIFDENKIEGIRETTAPLPTSFIMAIIGKPGSGKSTLCKNLILQDWGYKEKFNYIFIVSPSAEEFSDLIPKAQLNTQLDVPWLISRINKINKKHKENNTNVLFIIDDHVSTIHSLQNDKQFIKFFFNRRHLLWNGSVSIIITSQKYSLIPAKFRSNLSWIMFFKLNPLDLKKIYEELVVIDSRNDFNFIVKKGYKEKYSFISFDIGNQVFHINFNKI